ncbi:sugar ABC transporter substrate-binding protein [Streptomyces sp. C11-1]|uniref:Sugar ABC transporter substrate-binding protein n=1 Tax=Streptomyces durocortorensis TaxID=2811104 RepID=A0ABY9VTI8_9ACTN|nr:sugar ABC transporter substrate-binding protein [Streptomyces durocortorensis]WNF27244.1 sugar ABC transporter substrate-binding protein [Streptomyces durocortorensis]
MPRRRRVAACSALVFALLLAGCDHHRDDSPVDVTVWMYPVITDPQADAAYWKGIEEKFERATPGVRLTVERMPWSGRDWRIAEALAGGSGPDAILLMPDQIPYFTSQGALAPVDTALQGVLGRFLPTALDAVTEGGRIYGAPIYQTVTTTIYNKRLLSEAGVTTPPATWEEIKAAAPRLHSKGIALFDYSASDDASLNLNFYPLLWQAGGRVFTEDGDRVAFNGPEGVEALTFLTDLYRQGAIPSSAMSNTNRLGGQALGRQQAAMGYSVILADADLAARTWGKENVMVGGPLQGPAREAGFGAPGALAVNAESRHRAEAKEFLTFMVQPEQIRSLGKASGYLSPRTDVVVPSDSPYARQYQAALASASAGEPHPASRQVMSLLAPEIRAALTGRKSPAAALDAAAEAADVLLRPS